MKDNGMKESVQAQFGNNASNYVTSQTHAKGEDLQKLLHISGITGDEDCLDIATGGGHVANLLAPFVLKVTALDLTSEILKVARQFIEKNGHSNVSFIQGDAEQLPFQDECFDVVTCRIAAHHFPNVNAFVKEAFRVTRKGGTLLLIDNVAPELDHLDFFYNKIEKDRDPSHFRAWKKSEWYNLIEVTGFEIVESYSFDKKFHFDTWCDMMNLANEKRVHLSDFMIGATEAAHKKFRLHLRNKKVETFKGEAILLKATKPQE
ncbi:class I SAM-dependent methyltransferase [Alkalihalobacillus sp. MEB130]|nr:class I SAM-dependent methyltransferase [Alkalihalobacillus sp. MEB130]